MMKYIVLLSVVALCSGYSLERVEQLQNGVLCDLCVDTLELVKSASTSEEIEKLITDTATAVCGLVPGKYGKECATFLSQFIANNYEIIRKMVEVYPPQTVCKMIYACPRKNFTSESVEVDEICTICTDVVSVARGFITDPSLEKAIKTNLDALCITFGPFRGMCQRQVNKIVSDIFTKIDLVFSNLKDEEMCQIAGMCALPSSESTELLLLSLSNKYEVSMCDVCMDTVNEVENILLNKEIRNIAKHAADLSCGLIPVQALANQCKTHSEDMIKQVFELVDSLVKHWDANTLCRMAMVCRRMEETPALLAGLPTSPVQDICHLCEDSLNLVENILTDYQLEDTISTDAKFACKFTGLLHTMCEGYVDSFTRVIFQNIRDMFNSFENHQTCVIFDFCADSSNKTTVCDVCSASFDEVKSFITDPNLEHVITQNVDFACRMTGPFKRICTATANQIIGEVFSYMHMLDNLDGITFCSKFYLCKKPSLY